MSVIARLIDGATLELTTSGWISTEIYIVTGLAGPGHTRLRDAIVTSRIPKLNDIHAAVPILVTGLSAQAVASDNSDVIHVTVRYGNHNVSQSGGVVLPTVGDPPDITIGSTLQTVETDTDSQGNRLFVKYLKPDPTPGNAGNRTLVTKTVTIQSQRALTTISYTRREAESPLAKSLIYVGAVNSVALVDNGGAPRTWLCTHLGGPSPDGGKTFMVTYAFQKADDSPPVTEAGVEIPTNTWDTLSVYTDPETGEQPSDVKFGTPFGKKIIPVYEKEADFNLLGLTVLPNKPAVESRRIP